MSFYSASLSASEDLAEGSLWKISDWSIFWSALILLKGLASQERDKLGRGSSRDDIDPFVSRKALRSAIAD